MSSEHLLLLQRRGIISTLPSMKTTYMLSVFLIACGGGIETEVSQTLADSGVGAADPPPLSPIPVSAHPRGQDAASDAPAFDSGWVCQPCCLNEAEFNCVGGNASMTGECTDQGAPAVCDFATKVCLGLKCTP